MVRTLEAPLKQLGVTHRPSRLLLREMGVSNVDDREGVAHVGP